MATTLDTPTVAALNTASATVAQFAALNQNKASNLQEARALFEDARGIYKVAEANAVGVTVSGANIGAFHTVFDTAKGSAAVVGDVYKVASGTDTTDTIHATAKGSAPVAGDLFRWTKITAIETIQYIGPSSATAFATVDSNLAGS